VQDETSNPGDVTTNTMHVTPMRAVTQTYIYHRQDGMRLDIRTRKLRYDQLFSSFAFAFYLRHHNPGAILQLNMGEGKTRVILPMLILHWANGTNLLR